MPAGYPLTSTVMAWHVCVTAHTHTHAYAQINKCPRVEKDGGLVGKVTNSVDSNGKAIAWSSIGFCYNFG